MEKVIKKVLNLICLSVFLVSVFLVILILKESQTEEIIIGNQIFTKVIIVYVIMILISGFISIIEKNKRSRNEEVYESSVKNLTNREVVLSCIIDGLKKLKENNDSKEVQEALKILEGYYSGLNNGKN